MLDVAAGQIVADKYRIDELVGSGGMGVVVAATHIDLGQKVAIKLLRDVSEDSLARFRREARLIVRLRSEHVARVFDVGALDDDTPYIVMELLEGSDLSTVLSSRGKVSVQEAVDWVLEAAEAVAEAHALGMVHRDLKPANLFLAKGPGGVATVKVLDFGVSKVVDQELGAEASLTGSGTALGSPGYMSPEQMTDAREVDVRSDVWSLGALLYRLIGGRLPYRGESIVAVLAAMTIEPLVPLRTLAAEVTPELDTIVTRCLATDKVTRYANLAELAIALLPYASARGRLSVEQICATLDVTFHADGTTTVPVGVRAVGRPVADDAEAAAAPHTESTAVMHHAVAPHLVFPQTPSAPIPVAPVAEPAGDMPRAVLVGISSAVLAVTAGAIVWHLLTPNPKRDVAVGAAPSAVVSAPVPAPAPAPTPRSSATLVGVAGAPLGSPPPEPPTLEVVDAPAPAPSPRVVHVRRPTGHVPTATTSKPASTAPPTTKPTTTAPPASRH
ncbi:MAG: serine/threonine protein kinase [Myxococcales bacterium]|nr:serine/threonine protein kinase [Myxococcales bacterium]